MDRQIMVAGLLIDIEHAASGLFYATSEHMPGLFVAVRTEAEIEPEVRACIRALQETRATLREA
jgi:hypothetical protein